MTEKMSVITAGEMHALSVRLWNELWAESGESFDFPERDDVEGMQGLLSSLAWPGTRHTLRFPGGTLVRIVRQAIHDGLTREELHDLVDQAWRQES